MEKEVGEEIEETNFVIQGECISYENAYRLNTFETIDVFPMMEIIASVLAKILIETDKISDHLVTSFSAKSVPGISIKDYLFRIAKCSKCSSESVILALIYIDRLTERHNKFMIKSINIHRYMGSFFSNFRLLITGIMLAAKFFDDQFYNNEYFAKVGGISNIEMNLLEIEFLNLINFTLYVDPNIFFKYRQQLLAQAKTL